MVPAAPVTPVASQPEGVSFAKIMARVYVSEADEMDASGRGSCIQLDATNDLENHSWPIWVNRGTLISLPSTWGARKGTTCSCTRLPSLMMLCHVMSCYVMLCHVMFVRYCSVTCQQPTDSYACMAVWTCMEKVD